MTTRSPVALAALALTLMLFVASTANAVGPGKTCGGFIGIPCDGGAFCDKPAGACGVADGVATARPGDRKSTRLNSSHT